MPGHDKGRTIGLSVAVALSLLGCELGGSGPALGTDRAQPLYLSLAEAPVVVGGSGGQAIPVRVTSNSADSSYHTTLSVTQGARLQVRAKDGTIREFRGPNIVAEFYHIGRLLIVRQGATSAPQFAYFFEPIAWETLPPRSGGAVP